jgi:hypothetical protein
MTYGFMDRFDAPNVADVFRAVDGVQSGTSDSCRTGLFDQCRCVGLCITQVVFFDIKNNSEGLTAGPFVFFLIVSCLHPN